jgi:uncharacterized protein YajQ (UPF0234 family)
MIFMPSFDITSDVDIQEIDNAINQARKDLSQRFDFKGSTATIEWKEKESKIEMKAEDASRLKSLSEIVIGKLAKRAIDLRNVERKDPAISPLGHATQDFVITQGLDGEKAKEIVKAIKAQDFKVQSSLQDRSDPCHRQEARRPAGGDRLLQEQGLRRRSWIRKLPGLTPLQELIDD